jgi:2-methylcitrate dehydratase PrpD
VTATATPVSTRFADSIWSLAADGLPADVVGAAQRTLVNVLGTCVGGAEHPGVAAIAATGSLLGGREVAVPGLRSPLPLFAAAEAIGFAAHVDDFDDTDLRTVLHPGAAALGAAFVLAQVQGSTARAFLTAFAVGCEAELRLARAISPSHYDRGWHITGTTGSVGAAVTAGLLLGLDQPALESAINLAANEVLGHRENFGTMTKPFHPGKAAVNGVLAGVLAQQGVAGSADLLGVAGGYLDVLAEASDLAALLPGPGESWVLIDNSFKPYPCGIVSHPAIDAAIALHETFERYPQAGVVLRCHPLVVELTGNLNPKDGLQARFSTAHGVAVGIVFGRAGLAEYTDEVVLDGHVADVRGRVELKIDDTIDRDEAVALLVGPEGIIREVHVEHARGSIARPLTEAELADKVTRLIEPTLPGRAADVQQHVRALDTVADFERLVSLLQPGSAE